MKTKREKLFDDTAIPEVLRLRIEKIGKHHYIRAKHVSAYFYTKKHFTEE